jgi:hypothetical protein
MIKVLTATDVMHKCPEEIIRLLGQEFTVKNQQQKNAELTPTMLDILFFFYTFPIHDTQPLFLGVQTLRALLF